MAALFILAAAWLALAQQEEATRKPQAPASSKALEDFKKEASEYVIRLQGRPNDTLELREQPLLHWGNPVRFGEDGAVFVWTLDGRPEVIGSVFTFRKGNLIHRKHEYQSLAAGPLAAELRSQRVWAPRAAGVAFQPVADAPAPGANARLRLSQMKSLAGEFSANMVEFNEQKSELRMLAQPLIRYTPKGGHTVDGAIFAFSQGTDPEALLLLEARQTESGPQWQFAFARFTFMSLKGFHNGREVWRVEGFRDMPGLNIGSPKYQDHPYATYQVDASAPSDKDSP
jgi:hypothetical protein